MSKKSSSFEADLVARMREGDSEAWREFLRRYGRLIRYLGRRLRLDPEELDDLFQGVSIQIHRKLGTLEDPGRLVSWTYSVALNEGRQMLRRRRPTESIDQEAILRQVEAERSPEATTDELREATDDTERLRSALLGIDERCRLLLTALYFRDPRPSYEEVSQEFGIAVGSIGPIRGRCLERLSRQLSYVSNGELGVSTARDEGNESSASSPPRGGSVAKPRSTRPTSRRKR